MQPLFLSLAISSLLLLAPPALAEQGSLQQCQSIQDRIDHYTKLRRSGGSSGQMASWQKQRNHYKKLYSEYVCRTHRSDLK